MSTREPLTSKGLKYEHENGTQFTFEVSFGKEEVVLVAKTAKSSDTITFDAQTLLPKKERMIAYDDRIPDKEPLLHTTEFSIAEIRADEQSRVKPKGTPSMRYTMVENTFSPTAVGGTCDFEKSEYGKTHKSHYDMLERAIEALPPGFEASEIRNRFEIAASAISFGAYADKSQQLGGA